VGPALLRRLIGDEAGLAGEVRGSVSSLVTSPLGVRRVPLPGRGDRGGCWYLRYGLSYRDGEDLLAERGVEVDHVTVYRWVTGLPPLLADAARFARHAPVTGGSWTRPTSRALDLDGIDEPDTDWDAVLTQLPNAIERATAWLVHHVDAAFGQSSIVSSTLAIPTAAAPSQVWSWRTSSAASRSPTCPRNTAS
jgi:hypothetical protein